jgi:hypothetical protein
MENDLIMTIRIPKERKNNFLLYAALFGIEIIERSDGNTVSGWAGNENINDHKMED